MGNDTKVLTVSYGTFSCTLEGFSDSFGTMKAIAEYFRDLASENPNFAASPPKLDADIISGLASLNLSQKVTVQTQGSKVVLSSEAQDLTGDHYETDQIAIKKDLSLTKRMERIRELANRGAVSDDENEQTTIWLSKKPDPDNPADVFFAGPQVITAEPALGAASSQTRQAGKIEPTDLSEPQPSRQELRPSTVSQTGNSQTENQNKTIDKTHFDTVASLEIIFDDPTVDRPFENVQHIAAQQQNAAQVTKQDSTKKRSEVQGSKAEFSTLPKIVDNRKPAQSSPTEAPLAPPPKQKGASKLSPNTVSSYDQAPQKSVDTLPQAKPTSVRPVVKVVPKIAPSTNESSLDHSKINPPKKQPVPQALGVSSVTAVSNPSQNQQYESSFEENLTKLLLQEQNVLGGQEESIIATSGAAPQPARERTQVLRREQQDVSRLLQQTDQKMAHPGQSRRRNALAHLRAAVAANKGELPPSTYPSNREKMSSSAKLDIENGISDVEPSDRADAIKASGPLRLVQNQRIDIPTSAAHADTLDEPVQQPADFANYVNIVGAKTLEARIEAAASYLSLVVKRKKFSSRNVFRDSNSVSEEPIARSAFKRIFNALIEQEKIKDLGDGNFEINENKIGYQLPDPSRHHQ